jgi:hypothetical protein
MRITHRRRWNFLVDRELPDKGQHEFEESVKDLAEEF